MGQDHGGDEAGADASVAELARNFDVHNPLYTKCPYAPTAAYMRAQGEVVRADSYGGYWVAVRHGVIAKAGRNWRHFTNTRGVVIGTDKPQKFVPEELDPPAHSNFRRILNPFFTREAAQRLEGKIGALAEELIDGFIADGKVDLTDKYAAPISSMVFFDHLFGFTPEQAEYCRQAASDGMFGDSPELRFDGFSRVEKFAKDLVEERRGKPSDGGFIDSLRTGNLAGRPLTDDEIAGCIQLFIVAGGDTAILAMGSMFETLANNPDLRRRIVADMSLLPSAIEEMIRLESPSVAIQRTVTEDVEFGGQQLKEGDKLYLLWGSGNRDADVFENPDEFILDRPNIKDHVAFGAGAHKCIGEWYARTILRVATETLLRRIPDFEIEPGQEVLYLMGQSRGPLNMPVIF